MDNRRFNKKDLDAIGKMLFEQSTVSESKIDEIVARPDLFSGVLKRIADDQAKAVAIASKRRFVPQYAAAFASVLIMIAAVFGTYRYVQINYSNDSNEFRAAKTIVQVPVEIPVAARPDFPPKEENFGKPSPGRASNSETLAERTAFRTPARSAGRTRQAGNVDEEDGHFYPVSYNGDLEESASGGRVIRVNMTRSALFAMGVNVPLENGSETVKADLLVGADGVTRAVRVVE
ncbi:MAG TPA: hypothetical protein PLL77_01595 [Pyrinomonadaceae bacterium]|nr:hypothetical protein [Pyrinomonadaceae bacterium]